MVAPLKAGLAGLGTVGSAVVRLIERERDVIAARCGRPIEVVAVAARSRDKRRDLGTRELGTARLRFVDDPVALAGDRDIDVFVELMGGDGDPAKRCVETALAAGTSVVTANKALLARHGMALAALAEQSGATLNFEAAIGGAIPVVKLLREGLTGNPVGRVYGILNGTCNYILTRMEEEKLGFAECLKDAQRLGYAEADPAFDIEGFDTAQKLALLSSLAFGTRINTDAVFVEGISSITPEDLDAADGLGYRVKLLGVAMRTAHGIEQRVHPTMVPKETAIAQVMGVTNAVSIDAYGLAPITLVGPGAGGEATASAVVADLGDIARGIRVAPFGRRSDALAECRRTPMQRHEGGYYIRLLALDRPGTFAAIARHLADEKISLESIVQRHKGDRPHGGDDPESPATPAPVILITYATAEDAVRRALNAIKNQGLIAGQPQVIRIEKN
jgi:homoserine dehydrogenase